MNCSFFLFSATCNFIHIRYSIVHPKKSFFIENEHAKVKCNKGFDLVGAEKLKCTRYGNWSDSFPKCVGKFIRKLWWKCSHLSLVFKYFHHGQSLINYVWEGNGRNFQIFAGIFVILSKIYGSHLVSCPTLQKIHDPSLFDIM